MAGDMILPVLSWLLVIKVLHLGTWPALDRTLGRLAAAAAYPASILGFALLSWYGGLLGLPVWLALLLPFYWLLHWGALLLALSDLVRDPAHWRKTDHGCTARPVVSQEQVEVGAALSAQ